MKNLIEANLIKLNLGCGFNKMPGYLNVDKMADCAPDKVMDLEAKWPLADNSVVEVQCSHVLEHLGQQTPVFLGIMQELFRVCVDGAKIFIQVPHHDHWTFHADPTHVRKILPEGLKLFDKKLNYEHSKAGYANTALGIYCQVDFVLEKAQPHFDEPWASRLRSGLITQYDLDFAASHYTNAIVQWDIILRVRKNFEPPSS